MKLELTEKETTVIRWALIHYSICLENRLKTIPEKNIWNLYEEELNTTEKIIIKIKDEKSNLPK